MGATLTKRHQNIADNAPKNKGNMLRILIGKIRENSLSFLEKIEDPGQTHYSIGNTILGFSFSPFVLRSPGPLVPWSPGLLILWSLGPLET